MSRVDSGANWDLPFYGFLADFRCPKVSKGRAESPLVRPLAHTPCHGDQRADSGAGGGAAAPKGAVLSFEAKESTKESTRHGDSRGGPRRYAPWASVCGSPSGCPRPRLAALTRREKALYCPFLKEGVRNVARNEDGQLSPAFGARSCSLLSSFKKGKAFSLRCLSPLCSPAVGVEHTQMAVLGMLRRSLDIFATQKTSVNIESRWPFSASHEACRRMAVFSIQLTRSYIKPASREARCRAAVTPQPSHMSPYAPARPRRAGWGAGGHPLPLVRLPA